MVEFYAYLGVGPMIRTSAFSARTEFSVTTSRWGGSDRRTDLLEAAYELTPIPATRGACNAREQHLSQECAVERETRPGDDPRRA